MKLKLEFTAEIIEDLGDIQQNTDYTAEQSKAIIEDALKELCGENAVVIVHKYELTELA